MDGSVPLGDPRIEAGEVVTGSNDVLSMLAGRLEAKRGFLFSECADSPQLHEHLVNRTDHLIHDLRSNGVYARNCYAFVDEGYEAELTSLTGEERSEKVVDLMFKMNPAMNRFELGFDYMRSAIDRMRTPRYGKPANRYVESDFMAQTLDAMGVLPPGVTKDNIWSQIDSAKQHIEIRGFVDPWPKGNERRIEVIRRMSNDGQSYIGDVAFVTAPDLGLRIGFMLSYDGKTGASACGSSGFVLELTKESFADLSNNPNRAHAVPPPPPPVRAVYFM